MKTMNAHAGKVLSNPGIFRLFCFGLMIVFDLLSMTARAQFNPFTQITDDDHSKYNPAIYGDYVVFEDRGDGFGDIYLYNITTAELIPLSADPDIRSHNPDIWDNLVVWEEYHDGSLDIYYYDISRPDLGASPLIDLPGNQECPAIYENLLVWMEIPEGSYHYDIFLYDINTKELTQIINDDYDQYDPDIYGNNIVWEDLRDGNPDIYLYNIPTKEITRLTDDPGQQLNPCIDGLRVVWQDDRDGNWNIYMHAIDFMIDTPFENYDWKIKSGDENSDKENPKLWGDYLVYQDNRNGNQDLFLFSFFDRLNGNEIPLVTEEKGQVNPAVSGDRVVWQDERAWDGNYPYQADIWLWERPPGADLSVRVFDSPDPVVLGNDLNYEIYIRNFGPEDATNVVLTDIIPANLEYLHASSQKGGGCTLAGNTITCNIGDLAKGESDRVTVAAKTVKTGEIVNTASVTATETDPIQDNNVSTESTMIEWGYKYNPVKGKDPAIAVDAGGNVHICYLSDNNDLIYAANPGESWIIDTLTSSGEARSHGITVDKKGHVHIAYGEGGWDTKKLMYINDTAGVWSVPKVIFNDAGQCVSVNIKIDKENYIHISYMNGLFNGKLIYFTTKGSPIVSWDSYNSSSMDIDSAGFAHLSNYSQMGILHCTNSPDGQWNFWEVIDPDWNGSQLESLNNDIAVDKNSVPHISYAGAQTGSFNVDIRYAFKSGDTWENTLIDNGNSTGSRNAITTDENNKTHIIYYHNPSDEIRYATNDSGSWAKHVIATNIEGDPYGTGCDIASDASGYIHIAYEKGDYIFYMTNKVPTPPPPEPEIYVKPLKIDFQARHVGLPTDPEKVMIRNYGDTLLLINDISIIWEDSVHFTITNNTCSSLEPLDSCSVDIVYNPQHPGDHTARLMIESNDPDNPEVFVELSGTGLAPHMIDYGETAFGNVELRDSSVHDYVIKNLGNESLAIQEMRIEEGNTEDFYFTGLPTVPFSVSGNDSIVFQLIFKPTTLGDKTTKLKIFTNDYDPERILTGTGVKPMHSISGAIYTPSGDPVTEGRIFVYQPQEGSNETLLWHKPLGGDHEYVISGIPEGQITMRVDPDTLLYSGYLKTYLGNTTYWRDIVYFMLDNDTSGVDFILVPKPKELNGTCEVIGTLVIGKDNPGTIFAYEAYNGEGNTMEDIPVFLRDSQGETAAYDVTNGNGEFAFHNIPTGLYEFIADTFGIFMSEHNDSIDIKFENQKYYVTALLINDTIRIEIANATGVSGSVEPEMISVFPNPAKDNLYLKLESVDDEMPLIRIFSADGTLVKEMLPDNRMLISIPVSGLKKGIYILEVKSMNLNYQTKIVKQ